jgi:hypothetical protein
MNINFILYGNNQQGLINKLNLVPPTEKHLVTVKPASKKRSDLQNSLSHSWYGELEVNLKENNALGYKCFCKLHFGVPILRADDEEFRRVYDTAIKQLTYEQKLDIMRYFPVTSLMTTKQLSQYLETMKAHYMQHNGYELKFPNDWEGE